MQTHEKVTMRGESGQGLSLCCLLPSPEEAVWFWEGEARFTLYSCSFQQHTQHKAVTLNSVRLGLEEQLIPASSKFRPLQAQFSLQPRNQRRMTQAVTFLLMSFLSHLHHCATTNHLPRAQSFTFGITPSIQPEGFPKEFAGRGCFSEEGVEKAWSWPEVGRWQWGLPRPSLSRQGVVVMVEKLSKPQWGDLSSGGQRSWQ